MEETRIVENFAILLYSRTYQTLFLEILSSENKNPLSKHVIKTSDYVTIPLGRSLNQVQMMVFKSEQSMQILNEFKFGLQDFNTTSTVEQKGNYVKLKKKFSQYSLLLQIFYRVKSQINSSNNIEMQDEREALRISEEENKKQKLNEIKAMTKANIVLLGLKVLNGLFRKPKRCKTAIPSDGSIGRKPIRKNTKYKTVFLQENNFHHSKKLICTQSNLGKHSEGASSKHLSKQISIHNDYQQNQELKEDFNKNYKRQFPRRKHKQYLSVTRQNSAQMVKSQKKIRFDEDVLSIKNLSQDSSNNEYRHRNISSIHTKKSIVGGAKDNDEPIIKPRKRVNMITHQKEYYCTLENSRVEKLNQDEFVAGSYPISNFFQQKDCQKISNNSKMVIRKLKKLCQQRSGQKIQVKKENFPKPRLTLTLQKQHGQKVKDNPANNSLKKQRKLSNFRKRTYITNKSYNSHECFYQNLYDKTMNSIDRQKQIINFVKSSCNTIEFMPSTNLSIRVIKPNQNFQDLRITNLSTQTHETIQNLKNNKLKKTASQGQMYRMYKIYANNKKKLKS